jgi:Spy/CpxP family protein refolding chaperone
MNARTVSSALLPFASAALCGTLVFAQATAPPASPSDGPGATQNPAPIERPSPSPGAPGGRGPHFQRGPRQDGPSSPGPGMRDGMRGPMGASFGRGERGMWWKNPDVVQQLSLTPEQVRHMDTIMEQTRLQLIDLRANLEKQEVMLEPMLSANPVDTAKASAQIDKVAQARADLEKANAKMLLSIRAVLTPEQWTKLNDRRGRRGQGRVGQQGRPDAAPAGTGEPQASPGRGPGRPGY